MDRSGQGCRDASKLALFELPIVCEWGAAQASGRAVAAAEISAAEPEGARGGSGVSGTPSERETGVAPAPATVLEAMRGAVLRRSVFGAVSPCGVA